jgi:hypothetical protein
MNIKITIENAITKIKEIDVITEKKTSVIGNEWYDLNIVHDILSKVFPDSFVNISTDNGDFICGQPYNMIEDERAWEQGVITWEKYMEKWYPNLASIK